MQRRKGAAFELEISKILTDALGFVVQRRLGQARDGGHDLTECGPFVIECKRRANIPQSTWYFECMRRAELAIYEWYGQACEAAKAPRSIPVVIMRADGEVPLVMLSLEDFLPLMRGELAP